jgi:hypothetical protein
MIPAPSLLQLSPGIKIKDQTPKSKNQNQNQKNGTKKTKMFSDSVMLKP